MDVVVFAAYLALGPLAFALLGRVVAAERDQFPLEVVDGVGDTVFLPLLAGEVWAPATQASPAVMMGAAVVSLAVAAASMYITVFAQERDEWSRPERGVANTGTWYHGGFVFLTCWLLLAATPVGLSLAALNACVGFGTCFAYTLAGE